MWLYCSLVFIGMFIGMLFTKYFLDTRDDRDFRQLFRAPSPPPEAPPQQPKDAFLKNEPEEIEFLNSTKNNSCDLCGKPYLKHKYDMRYLNPHGRPYLRVRCDGMRLKL